MRTWDEVYNVHCRVVPWNQEKTTSVSGKCRASRHLMLRCVDTPYCVWDCSGSMRMTGDSTSTYQQTSAHSVRHTTRTLPCLWKIFMFSERLFDTTKVISSMDWFLVHQRRTYFINTCYIYMYVFTHTYMCMYVCIHSKSWCLKKLLFK